ncbi:MAG: RluA family pseudouridine synthase [Bacteroidetes bacterium]|nr:RluA family pseudouridine synthase [Bacteroidota bacterium]
MSEDLESITEEKELFEHKKFVVDKGQEPLRADKFLFTHIANSTRTRVQSAIEAGNVLVNGRQIKSSYKVKPADEISIVLAHPPKEINILPENIPLEIIYEDDDLLVINKKAGMVVHPAHGNYSGTLINALLYYLNQISTLKGEKKKVQSPLLPSGQGQDASVRPGLVHRLDKETSGLIIVAKNELSLAKLAKEMFDRKISRRYVALVWGEPKEKEGTINVHIGRSLSDRKKMAAFPEGNHGKPAITLYKVLENFKYVSLVECKLETGRTHQIRVHMKHIGHTVFGDADYGGNKILKSSTHGKYKEMVEKCFRICPRQSLHAKYLSFEHPTAKKKMDFETDLPDDMKTIIKLWRDYIKS